MKLHQLVTEVFVPQTVQMILGQIVRDGKVTNNYQYFVLAQVSEYFKNGVQPLLDFSEPMTAGSNATSTVVIDALKALSPQDQVNLATYLLDCVVAGESALREPNASVVDWMHFVLRKQD